MRHGLIESNKKKCFRARGFGRLKKRMNQLRECACVKERERKERDGVRKGRK